MENPYTETPARRYSLPSWLITQTVNRAHRFGGRRVLVRKRSRLPLPPVTSRQPPARCWPAPVCAPSTTTPPTTTCWKPAPEPTDPNAGPKAVPVYGSEVSVPSLEARRGASTPPARMNMRTVARPAPDATSTSWTSARRTARDLDLGRWHWVCPPSGGDGARNVPPAVRGTGSPPSSITQAPSTAESGGLGLFMNADMAIVSTVVSTVLSATMGIMNRPMAPGPTR